MNLVMHLQIKQMSSHVGIHSTERVIQQVNVNISIHSPVHVTINRV